MADISMCNGKYSNTEGETKDCLYKSKCYRHTAPMNKHWQSMIVVQNVDESEGCTYFWLNEGYGR